MDLVSILPFDASRKNMQACCITLTGRHVAHSDLQEQEKKQRIRGIDAQRAHIKAAKAIARILRSSLGPNGMDKLLQGPDGDVCISMQLILNLSCCLAETQISSDLLD